MISGLEEEEREERQLYYRCGEQLYSEEMLFFCISELINNIMKIKFIIAILF